MSDLAVCKFVLEERAANFLSICYQLSFLSLSSLAEKFYALSFKSSVPKRKSFLCHLRILPCSNLAGGQMCLQRYFCRWRNGSALALI